MRSAKMFVASVTRTPLSLVGSVMTTVSALLFIMIIVSELVGIHVGPYIGILGFVVVPTIFVIGLLLIPLGLWLDKRKRIKQGDTAGPVLDLGSATTRRKLRIFILATIINVVILGVATFKGIEVMETTEFCGQTCHSVMQPEFTAYQRSAHARVKCVECHIGEGASWFVKSKLSGSWQLVSVAFDLYPRPVPTPIHNLRPARETCEHCHWPAKFVGDRLRIISHFNEDEKNTETKTVMVMKVGGHRGDKSQGIHWHVDPANIVRYRSDPTRETIYEVELLDAGGTSVGRWRGPEADKPDAAAASTWRVMDCVDCHNRPAHTFKPPQVEVDNALADGHLDPKIPFLRREGLKALKQEYPSHEAAREGIARALSEFYGKSYPAVSADAVAGAARTLGDIYTSNVFPTMKITWGSYKNQAGHSVDMGCMRCHNGDHKKQDGSVISSDCDACHTVLADGEENPEILKTLQP